MKEAAHICFEQGQEYEGRALKSNEFCIAHLEAAYSFYMTATKLYGQSNMIEDANTASQFALRVRGDRKMAKKRRFEKDLDELIDTVPKRLKTIFKNKDEAVNKVKYSLIELKKLL
jgi:hypothetical protein